MRLRLKRQSGVDAATRTRSEPCAHILRFTFYVSRFAQQATRNTSSAFTMIELILVMAIVVVSISITAPKLANFFRGRTLNSEARRLLALTHSGQARAISEGIPTRLQFDIPSHSYELKQDPGWSDRDPKAMQFSCDQDLDIEVINADRSRSVSSTGKLPDRFLSRANPRNLPEIRFLPDGSIDETSPRALHLQDKNGASLWLAQATNHLSYEIRSSFN
jgi:type II secretory pathway pseudopilin PulG